MNKKGQTLVEVVVALGILAIVFSGTVTLIMNVVNLTLSSRYRTEAVALAQKEIAERTSALTYGCSLGLGTAEDNSDYFTDAAYPNQYSTNYHVVVSINPTSDDLVSSGTTFQKIVVNVSWASRDFSDENYSVNQIVRNY